MIDLDEVIGVQVIPRKVRKTMEKEEFTLFNIQASDANKEGAEEIHEWKIVDGLRIVLEGNISREAPAIRAAGRRPL